MTLRSQGLVLMLIPADKKGVLSLGEELSGLSFVQIFPNMLSVSYSSHNPHLSFHRRPFV